MDFDRKETSLKKKSVSYAQISKIFDFLEIIEISFKILKELVIYDYDQFLKDFKGNLIFQC